MKMTTKTNVTRRLIAFVIAIALAFNFIPAVNNAKAYKDGDVLASFTYADGVTRNLVTYDDVLYADGVELPAIDPDEIGFDKYGTLWYTFWDNIYYVYVNPFEKQLVFRLGEGLAYNLDNESFKNMGSYMNDGDNVEVKSLVYDDGYVVGFVDTHDNTYNVLNLQEQNEVSIQLKGVEAVDYSTYLPEGYVTTEATGTTEGSFATTSADATTEAIVTTETPTTTEEFDFFIPVVIKNGNKYTYRAYNTDYLYLGTYTLSKNVLKYNGKKYKNVKYAGFIEKSANVIYITKKGQAYTVTKKGKKKTLLKKNAKSLVKNERGFVTKIKKKSGTMNVKNK